MTLGSRLLLVALLLSCSSCSAADDAGSDQPSPRAVLSASTRRMVVEVDYAKGAEPYVGGAGSLRDIWQLTRDNLVGLVGSGKSVEVPSALDAMERLEDVAGDRFDADAILAIAGRHRSVRSSGDLASYYVLYLPGLFVKDGVPQEDTLGVSIGDTGVVAMFKPVIVTVDAPAFPGVVRFTEQSVLVHELGHALGLVDNGVPLTSPHKDTAHGAHCTNTKCVMYWANEGKRDVLEFARRAAQSGSLGLYGEECLADARALQGR